MPGRHTDRPRERDMVAFCGDRLVSIGSKQYPDGVL